MNRVFLLSLAIFIPLVSSAEKVAPAYRCKAVHTGGFDISESKFIGFYEPFEIRLEPYQKVLPRIADEADKLELLWSLVGARPYTDEPNMNQAIHDYGPESYVKVAFPFVGYTFRVTTDDPTSHLNYRPCIYTEDEVYRCPSYLTEAILLFNAKANRFTYAQSGDWHKNGGSDSLLMHGTCKAFYD